MERIALIGSGGAGKSTLAKQLGQALGLPVYHLDALYWKPGWVETPREAWVALQQELISQPRWIIDGNYSGTMATRLAAADTVIFMDFSRWACLWGVLRRRMQYAGRSRPDMAEGCPERLDWQFLRWIWEFPVNRRPAIEQRLAVLRPDQRVIRLKSRRAVARFLAETTRI